MMKNEQLKKALEVAKTGDWDRANHLLDGYGIESVECAGRQLQYVNLGDTYSITICQEDEDVFIGSWGEWYEEVENEHCKKENVIRCGYCSEFTPMNKPDWRDITCEFCGNCVAG